MAADPPAPSVDARLVAAWPELAGLAPKPVAGGLINTTLALGERHILQRLHPVFSPEVNDDIAALVPHLQAAGVPAPTLVRTRTGATHLIVTEGEAAGVWRVLTRLPGRTLHRLEGGAQIHAVATALAAFHGALSGVRHRFASRRLAIHDTPKHMEALRAALVAYPAHRLHGAVTALAAELFTRWRAFGVPPELPERIGHGGPKISNFLFACAPGSSEITGVIDLDTLGPTTLDAELGDALRSWCSTADESAPEARFDAALFATATEAYLERAAGWITEAELRALPGAPERISLELAARFAADALAESYFGWDPARAPSRGDHNLLRARNQLALARSIAAQRPALEAHLRPLRHLAARP